MIVVLPGLFSYLFFQSKIKNKMTNSEDLDEMARCFYSMFWSAGQKGLGTF